MDNEDADAARSARRSDTGRAAVLVDRLAQRMGWRIEEDPHGITLELP
jgi:hypothetical protein